MKLRLPKIKKFKPFKEITIEGGTKLYSKHFFVNHPTLDAAEREKQEVYDANYVDILYDSLDLLLLTKHKGVKLKPTDSANAKKKFLERLNVLRTGAPEYAAYMSDPNGYDADAAHKTVYLRCDAMVHPNMAVTYTVGIRSCKMPAKIEGTARNVIHTDLMELYHFPARSRNE